MDNQSIPTKNAVVKVNCWHGVVTNVYVNGDATNPLLEIQFVKNVLRGQPAEFHRWSDLALHLTPSDRGALCSEAEFLQTALATRMDEFIQNV